MRPAAVFPDPLGMDAQTLDVADPCTAVLFGAIILLVVVDLVADLADGTSLGHVVFEGLVAVVGAVGLAVVLLPPLLDRLDVGSTSAAVFVGLGVLVVLASLGQGIGSAIGASMSAVGGVTQAPR